MIYHWVRLESCLSTNDEARDLADKGAAEGTIVVASEQTAGRGTKGRDWFSAKGLGLYLTVVLRPEPRNLAFLPLAAGLAVADAVELSHGPAPKLLWPNDLVLEGKKMAGILCENTFAGSVLEHALLGAGINVNHERSDFPPGLRDSAVSVRMACGKPADGEALLRAFASAFEEWYGIFQAGRGAEIAAAFAGRSEFSPGERVFVDQGGGPRRGTEEGIGPDGTLLVSFPDGFRRLTSAEVRRVLNP